MAETAYKAASADHHVIFTRLQYFADDEEKANAARYVVRSMLGQVSAEGMGLDSIESIYNMLDSADIVTIDSATIARGKEFMKLAVTRTSDLTNVSADYLIDNLEDSYHYWKTRPWNNNLPSDLFYELLLPYRMGDEPLTSWRRPYRLWLASLEDSIAHLDNSVEAAALVSAFIHPCPYNRDFITPHRSALRLLVTPLGYCREDCDRTVYAMRSMGIPVTYDSYPASPDNGGVHQWMMVYDNTDRRYRMFDNLYLQPTRDSLHNDTRRKGKVFRHTFAPHFDRLVGRKNVPSKLADIHVIDVTAEYFGVNQAIVEAIADRDIYLGVFGHQQFLPIDFGKKRDGKLIFNNIEPDLVYFPITDMGNKFVHCGYPFLLCRDGHTHIFKPDNNHWQHIRLTRKMPMIAYHKERLSSAVGCHIQTGPTSKGPWTDIHLVTAPSAHSYARIPVNLGSDRYVRFLKENDGPLFAEIIVSRDSLARNPVEAHMSEEKYAVMTDNDVLTWTGVPWGAEDVITEISSPADVQYLFYVLLNDDNFVVPGQEYELLYSSDLGWVSLGKKTSDNFFIDFDAPHNAVLLLRNLTKGVEEQVFIYVAGRQMFNIDLKGQSIF